MRNQSGDYIRWNGTFRNTSVRPTAIAIQQTRDSPLLYNPKDYQVAVESISIDTAESPMFTALVKQSGASSINDLNYYVQFLWSGTTSTRFLQMVSVYPQYAPPTIAANNSQVYQPYYAVQDAQSFLSMINTALSNCYLDLQAQVGYPTADASPPYVTMDPTSGILAFVVPQTMITNSVDIVLENELMDKLNLPFSEVVQNNPIAPTPNICHKIASTAFTKFQYVTSTSMPTVYTTTPYWSFPARALLTDHDYRASWYDVYRILLVSDLAAPESMSFSSDQTSVQNNSENVLASYYVDLSGTDHINGQLIYDPYYLKWVAIQPSDAIQMINIRFMYQTKSGAIFPMLQMFNRTAEVKLVFKKIHVTDPKITEITKKRKLGEK